MTTVPEVFARTWNENILFSVVLELTFACNLDCHYCYNDRERQGTPLTTPEYLNLLDELAEMQVLNLVLSGGEPLVHPDFFAIGSHARERGFAIRIKSNGHALLPEVATRIKRELDPFVIDLSLHGATAATHDRQTRVPGSFERLLGNLRHMREAGIRLRLTCTLTSWNEHEAEAIVQLGQELSVAILFSPFVTPRDSGDLSPMDLNPSSDAVQRLQSALPSTLPGDGETAGRRTRAPGDDAVPGEPVEPFTVRCCGAASSSVTIDPYGNVLPCVQWRRPIGNLRAATFPSIWESSPEIRRIRAITESVKVHGGAVIRCGQITRTCPALAEMLGGSPNG